MKIVKKLNLLFCACISLTVAAQNTPVSEVKTPKLLTSYENVHFFKGTFKEALKKAAAEKKWIFIDVYTDWCGPCKMMSAEAFRDPDIADKMNAFFINFKANAEKGERDVAAQYGVRSYPTVMIVDSTGTLLKKSSGYGGVEPFRGSMNFILTAIEGGKQFIVFADGYKKGNRNLDFLIGYARARKLAGISSTRITDNLLKELPKDSLELMPYKQFLASNAYELEGNTFDYILQNRQDPVFEARLKLLQRLYLIDAIAQKDKSLLKKLMKANNKLIADPLVLAETNEQLALEFYQKTQNGKEAHNTATDLMTKHYMPHFEKAKNGNNEADLKLYLAKMQAIGLYYADNVTEKKHLEEMSKLIDKACAGHECVELLTAYSQVLYRMKDKTKAKALMNKAITMSGNDKNLLNILDKMDKDTF
jgi:thiol-disulfide isomerase/thioredoxin